MALQCGHNGEVAGCAPCTVYRNRLAANIEVLSVTRAPIPPRPDCVYLGHVLPDQPRCGCREKLRKCGLHGVCRTEVERDGVRCCRTCPDYEEP